MRRAAAAQCFAELKHKLLRQLRADSDSSPEWAWRGLLGAYALLVLFSTLSPWASVADTAALNQALTLALAPQLGWRDLVDAARNLLLFAAWGGLWMLRLQRAWRATDLVAAVFSGLLLSLLIEGLQLFNALRHSNVLDLLTNGLGAGLGAAALLLARRWVGPRLFNSGALVLTVVVAGYTTALALDILFPVTRLHIPSSIWGTPLERARAILQHPDFTPWAWPWLDWLICLPAGWLVQRLYQTWGLAQRADLLRLGLTTVAIVILLELAHPFLGYPPQIGAVLIHLTGLAFGALAAQIITPGWRAAAQPMQQRWWALAYGLLIGFWLLRPYAFAWPTANGMSTMPWDHLIPLAGHKWHTSIFSVVDLLKTICLFAPLGAMLALQPLSQRRFLRGVWPVVYLSGGLELAQVFIAGRYPDGTDVVVAVAAAWLVMVLLDRCRADDPAHLNSEVHSRRIRAPK